MDLTQWIQWSCKTEWILYLWILKHSKTSDPHRLLLNLFDKINLKRSDKYVAWSNFSIYYIWKNIKKPYKNNNLKTSAPTWKEDFELLDGSYSVSYNEDCFEYILKNMKRDY